MVKGQLTLDQSTLTHSLTHWWIYVFVYRPGSWIM